MGKPLISIVVPTYNSAANLSHFFQSCVTSSFKNFEIIINDDPRTSDNTDVVVRRYKKLLSLNHIRTNNSMAQARKRGAAYAKGSVLMHLDSDMRLSTKLLEECAVLMKTHDGLVIPEESIGETFWAKCKWLEKKYYEEITEIESLRCISSKVYEAVGGHDERMVFSEDKDLDIRVRKLGVDIGRSKNVLFHNEGKLSLMKTLRKKEGYTKSANIFAVKHPDHYRWQINIFNRYVIYFSKPKLFISHPILFAGMIYMKTLEFCAGAIGLISAKRRVSEVASNHRNARI